MQSVVAGKVNKKIRFRNGGFEKEILNREKSASRYIDAECK